METYADRPRTLKARGQEIPKELETEIQRDLQDGIDTTGGKNDAVPAIPKQNAESQRKGKHKTGQGKSSCGH